MMGWSLLALNSMATTLRQTDGTNNINNILQVAAHPSQIANAVNQHSSINFVLFYNNCKLVFLCWSQWEQLAECIQKFGFCDSHKITQGFCGRARNLPRTS